MQTLIPLPDQPEAAASPTPMVYVKEDSAWTYKVVTRDLASEGLLGGEALQPLGADGWELAGVLAHEGLAHYYFKKSA